MRNRIEPKRHGRNARQAAPDMQTEYRGGVRDTLQPHQYRKNDHTRQTAVKKNFHRAVMRRGQLDAYAHDGKKQCAQRHPEGLHRKNRDRR